MKTIEVAVGEANAGERVDRFLAQACGLSRAVVQRLVDGGEVCLNGAPAPKGRKLAAGDRLVVTIPPPEETDIISQDIPINVVYEDAHLLVVDKPKGMVVHPAAGNPDGTLVNALMHHCAGSLSGIGGELRPGIVHRIDKDTSGLLVVAKDDETHAGLAAQFERHSINRVYQAVVYGNFKHTEGEIDAPIGRSQTDRKKMAVTQHRSKAAVTNYRVLGSYPGFTHLELKLKTGRTHQIRVHMANVGHPLAGDAVYGPKKVIKQLAGQCLHAGVLGFVHPATGQWLEFNSPLPEYFVEFLGQIAGEKNADAEESAGEPADGRIPE